MKLENLIRISGMFLLAAVVSAVVLLLVYAMQHPQVMMNLAAVGSNGSFRP